MEIRSVEAIIRALNSAEVEYLIVGGLAVNAHGFVRLTRDVDIVIRLVPENTRRALRALQDIGYQTMIPEGAEGFADPATRQRWRDEKGMVVLKLWGDAHERTPVDIFIDEPFGYDEEAARAVWLHVTPDLVAPVVSLARLLQMKREAGRPQDLTDITELERAR